MKTIEERATEYSKGQWDELTARTAYIAGIKEQKAIDDAELLKLKASWEKEAQINHNNEANYIQGCHDTVEKAAKVFSEMLVEMWPDLLGFGGIAKKYENEFRKRLEK